MCCQDLPALKYAIGVANGEVAVGVRDKFVAWGGRALSVSLGFYCIFRSRLWLWLRIYSPWHFVWWGMCSCKVALHTFCSCSRMTDRLIRVLWKVSHTGCNWRLNAQLQYPLSIPLSWPFPNTPTPFTLFSSPLRLHFFPCHLWAEVWVHST